MSTQTDLTQPLHLGPARQADTRLITRNVNALRTEGALDPLRTRDDLRLMMDPAMPADPTRRGTLRDATRGASPVAALP